MAYGFLGLFIGIVAGSVGVFLLLTDVIVDKNKEIKWLRDALRKRRGFHE